MSEWARVACQGLQAVCLWVGLVLLASHVAWVDWSERATRGQILAVRSLIQPVAESASTSQGIRSGIAPTSRNITATMPMMVSQGSFGFLARLRRR